MRINFQKQLVDQCDRVIEEFNALQARSQFKDLSDQPGSDLHRVITMARSTIERSTGSASPYGKQMHEFLCREGVYDGKKLVWMVGVVQSLRSDLQAGYVRSVEELIHGEVFGDFLDMARYLLEETYKDAAAVIAGSALEAHLRQLCERSGIDTDITTSSGVRHKKADQMNTDLAKASIYDKDKLDQKNVTAWLDLRNNAARGKYDNYAKEQVSLMISGVQDFITRNPA